MKKRKPAVWIAWGFVPVLMVVALLTNNGGFDFWAYEGIWSVTPPLVVLMLVLATRRLSLSLFGGVVFGAWLVSLENLNPLPALSGMVAGTTRVIVDAVGSGEGAALLLLVACGAGLGGLVSASGGSYALGVWLRKRVKGPVGAQLATLAIGALGCFDGPAGVLAGGMAARACGDSHGVSRARTAFLLRITGSLGVGLLAASECPPPYRLFACALPLFALVSGISLRDFGPMRRYERLSRAGQSEGMADEEEGLPQTQQELLGTQKGRNSLWNAVIPLCVLLAGALIRLLTGVPGALFMSVLIACAVALLMGIAKRSFRAEEGARAWFAGVKSAAPLLVTLVLSLTLGHLTADLGTGAFLSELGLFDGPGFLLPAALFLVGGGMGMATGSGAASMALLLPMAASLSGAGVASLLTGAVISGALWGELCSPAAPMLTLASLGALCNPTAHYRSHLPYALAAGACCLLFGFLPMGLGLTVWAALPLSLAACAALPFIMGRRVPPTPDAPVVQGNSHDARKIELLRQSDKLYRRKKPDVRAK